MSFAAADPIVEYILKSRSRIYSIFRFSAFAVIHMPANPAYISFYSSTLISLSIGIDREDP
jgi:hypothetical protein